MVYVYLSLFVFYKGMLCESVDDYYVNIILVVYYRSNFNKRTLLISWLCRAESQIGKFCVLRTAKQKHDGVHNTSYFPKRTILHAPLRMGTLSRGLSAKMKAVRIIA